MTGHGTFTLSLDAELAWGSFDRGGLERYAADYRRTPDVLDRLCALLDEYDVPATWAFVGHLLEDCDGDHERATARQREWLASAPCSTGVERALWHAPDLLDRVRSSGVDHDVGLHGYSHLPLAGVDRDTATAEVRMAVEAARGADVDPVSFVYPRNRIGHTDVLAEQGLGAYRDRDARWYEGRSVPSSVRKPLRWLDEVGGFAPPTGQATRRGGIVAVPGSHPFRPTHGPWRWTPPGSQRWRALRGLDRAADTGQLYHLWLHPFNLARNPDTLFETLAAVFERVAALREANRLTVATMADLARTTAGGVAAAGRPNDLSSPPPEDPNASRRTP